MLNLKSLVAMTVYVEPAQFLEKEFFSNGKFSIMETSLYFDAIFGLYLKRVIKNQQTPIKHSEREPLDDATY